MQELTSILRHHARKYPLMEPRDAVKLLYQNEFGGGHLIPDETACLVYLRREYEATPRDSSIPLLEPIGNGISRVMLAALDEAAYSPEQLGRDFIRSARMHQGTMEAFTKKLSLLQKLTLDGQMPFSPDALDAYLAEYARAGYPPVSHSDAYRAAYRPAYRVLDVSCITTIPPESGAAVK